MNLFPVLVLVLIYFDHIYCISHATTSVCIGTVHSLLLFNQGSKRSQAMKPRAAHDLLNGPQNVFGPVQLPLSPFISSKCQHTEAVLW